MLNNILILFITKNVYLLPLLNLCQLKIQKPLVDSSWKIKKPHTSLSFCNYPIVQSINIYTNHQFPFNLDNFKFKKKRGRTFMYGAKLYSSQYKHHFIKATVKLRETSLKSVGSSLVKLKILNLALCKAEQVQNRQVDVWLNCRLILLMSYQYYNINPESEQRRL